MCRAVSLKAGIRAGLACDCALPTKHTHDLTHIDGRVKPDGLPVVVNNMLDGNPKPSAMSKHFRLGASEAQFEATGARWIDRDTLRNSNRAAVEADMLTLSLRAPLVRESGVAQRGISSDAHMEAGNRSLQERHHLGNTQTLTSSM